MRPPIPSIDQPEVAPLVTPSRRVLIGFFGTIQPVPPSPKFPCRRRRISAVRISAAVCESPKCMMRTGSSRCRDRASRSARKKFCSAAGFSMPLRGGSSATVTRLEMRLSVRRASRKIIDSFPMTAAIITRSRTWVNVVTHTFPRRRDARLRAAAAGSRRKCSVKLDAGEFHARGVAINHRAEADALWRPFFRAGAEHSIAERGERRALRGQLSLAHEDPRAAEPRAVVAVMSDVRVPFFRILKRLLARVAIVCKPPCAMKSLHDLVVIASEFQKEQFEVWMLDEEAIGPGALQGDALTTNGEPQSASIR